MGTNGKRTVVSADRLYCVLWCLNRDQMPFETQVQTLWPAPQDSLQQLEMPTNSFFLLFRLLLTFLEKKCAQPFPPTPMLAQKCNVKSQESTFHFGQCCTRGLSKKKECMRACLFWGRLCSRKPCDVLFRKYFCTEIKVSLSQKDVPVRWRLDQG